MYIETNSNNNGDFVFCSFERTDIIQITNITFYYYRFSAGSTKSMGRFRNQLLLDDNTWSTQYTIPKKDRYSDTSTDWTLLDLDFTVEKYGIKLFLYQIDTPHSDMCFSNITITHSVFWMNNSNYFTDIVESMPDYRKVVLLLSVIKNDKYLLLDIGFSERDINRLNLEFRYILIEQHEEHLDHIKTEEEFLIEKIFK